MTKGTSVASLGIGIGGYGGTYVANSTPTIMAKYEKGILNDWGPGNLSVGGVIAIQLVSFFISPAKAF